MVKTKNNITNLTKKGEIDLVLGDKSYENCFIELMQSFNVGSLYNKKKANFKKLASYYQTTILKHDVSHYFYLVDNKVIGHVGVSYYTSYPDGKTAFLHDVVILPKFRGKGYGSDMIRRIIDTLINIDTRKVILYTEVYRYIAHKVYSEVGFRQSTDIFFILNLNDKNKLAIKMS